MMNQIEFYESKLAYEMDPSDLFKALENGTDHIVVDTRQDFGYEKEHIPSAINLPHREISKATVEGLDKTKIYVCYCDGIGCNASTKGALKLSKLGFQVRELIGGIEWWKFDGYETHGVQSFNGAKVNCAC